jgi:hypothetical protein
VHVAFGAGLPGNVNDRSTYGTFDEHAKMMALFGREVISAFRTGGHE